MYVCKYYVYILCMYVCMYVCQESDQQPVPVVRVVDADDEGELAGLVLQHLRICRRHVREKPAMPCHTYIHSNMHYIHRVCQVTSALRLRRTCIGGAGLCGGTSNTCSSSCPPDQIDSGLTVCMYVCMYVCMDKCFVYVW